MTFKYRLVSRRRCVCVNVIQYRATTQRRLEVWRPVPPLLYGNTLASGLQRIGPYATSAAMLAGIFQSLEAVRCTKVSVVQIPVSTRRRRRWAMLSGRNGREKRNLREKDKGGSPFSMSTSPLGQRTHRERFLCMYCTHTSKRSPPSPVFSPQSPGPESHRSDRSH